MNRPLVILDLDETLIFASKQKLERYPDFKVFDYHVYKRPGLTEFVNRLSSSYEIAIWSSAGNEYVNAIVSKLELNVELQFVWGRNEATQRKIRNDFHDTGFEDEVYYVKSLKKVKKKGYDLERVLIVDDSPHKSKLNYGNAIYPNSFKGALIDTELSSLIAYLESVKDEPNFRIIEKRDWRN